MKLIKYCIQLFSKKDEVTIQDTEITFDYNNDQLHEYHNPWLSINS